MQHQRRNSQALRTWLLALVLAAPLIAQAQGENYGPNPDNANRIRRQTQVAPGVAPVPAPPPAPQNAATPPEPIAPQIAAPPPYSEVAPSPIPSKPVPRKKPTFTGDANVAVSAGTNQALSKWVPWMVAGFALAIILVIAKAIRRRNHKTIWEDKPIVCWRLWPDMAPSVSVRMPPSKERRRRPRDSGLDWNVVHVEPRATVHGTALRPGRSS